MRSLQAVAANNSEASASVKSCALSFRVAWGQVLQAGANTDVECPLLMQTMP